MIKKRRTTIQDSKTTSFRFRKVLTNDFTWKILPTPQSYVLTREFRTAPLIHLVSVFDPTARTLMGTRASGLLRYADVGMLPREVHGSMHAQFAMLVVISHVFHMLSAQMSNNPLFPHLKS